MAECNELEFELPGFSGRKIEGNFEGGNVSSDGGLVLLRQVDRWIGLTKTLAQRLPDGRDPDKIEHSLESMLRQRIYGLALGYGDLNVPASHCNSSFAPAWFTSTGELQSGADLGTRKTMVASAGCLPMPLLRHHLARFSASHFPIATSRTSPLRKPSHGAKSGLEVRLQNRTAHSPA
jgi:hypothetical protein